MQTAHAEHRRCPISERILDHAEGRWVVLFR